MTSVRNSKYSNLQDVKEALEALGADTSGRLPELRARLIKELDLKPQETNLDGKRANRRRSPSPGGAEAAGDQRARSQAAGDQPKKPKPPPPPSPSPGGAEEWRSWIDSEKKKPYWENTRTGELTWRNPHKPAPPASAVTLGTDRARVTLSPRDHGLTNALSSFAAAGGNLTLVQPGAYASGCVVNNYVCAPDFEQQNARRLPPPRELQAPREQPPYPPPPPYHGGRYEPYR